MKIVLVLIFALYFLYLSYKRYFPVLGVPNIQLNDMYRNNHNTILDIRDYNVSDKEPISKAETIPLAYLTRHYPDVSCKQVYLIAPDLVAKNLCIRFLRAKGYDVKGYHIVKEDSPQINCVC